MEWKSILIIIMVNFTRLPKSPNPATTRQLGINTPVSELGMEDEHTQNEEMTGYKCIIDNNNSIIALSWEFFQIAKCHHSPGHKQLASPGEAF